MAKAKIKKNFHKNRKSSGSGNYGWEYIVTSMIDIIPSVDIMGLFIVKKEERFYEKNVPAI